LDSVFYVHDLDYHWHSAENNDWVDPAVLEHQARAWPTTTAFYDGQCPVCIREVAHYTSLDKGGRLKFQDISQDLPESLARFGVTHEDALTSMHVVDTRGQLHTGVMAFVPLWDKLPYFQWLAFVTRVIPPFVMKLCYVAWQRWRNVPAWLKQSKERPASPLPAVS
jgi:predicted DCC family thiol-disulfide oxidoreductase YuxK